MLVTKLTWSTRVILFPKRHFFNYYINKTRPFVLTNTQNVSFQEKWWQPLNCRRRRRVLYIQHGTNSQTQFISQKATKLNVGGGAVTHQKSSSPPPPPVDVLMNQNNLAKGLAKVLKFNLQGIRKLQQGGLWLRCIGSTNSKPPCRASGPDFYEMNFFS